MTPKLKKIILTVSFIGILFLIYVMFIKKPEEQDPLIAGMDSLKVRTVEETKILGDQITQALIQIESLKLDRNVIDSNLFKSLIDRSEPIISEPVGRRNPFAPLSDTSVNYNSGVGSVDNNSTTTIRTSTTTSTLPPVNNTQPTTTRPSATSSNFLPN